MIERTEFDLRLSAHRTRIARANTLAWMGEGPRGRRTPREVLAAALCARAWRRDSATRGARGAERVVTAAARS